MWSLGGFSVALGTSTTVGKARFDFARTTTNVAAASASCAAFVATADWNTCHGFFASATTCKAGGRSLAVALRAQCFLRHLPMRLPQPPLSMDRCVDDQHYNDSAQNDHPIGKFSARYRCLFAKPFHDLLPSSGTGSPRARSATESSRPRIVSV